MKSLSPKLAITIAILITIGVSLTTLFSQSIRLDEAQSIWVYTKSVPTLMKMTGQDVLVPLYGLLLHFWLQIFGPSIVAARLLSLLLFILTVPVLYKLAQEAGNKRMAFVTILLFSMSPFIVWYSNEARMYTLFLFSTTLNHLFFLRLYNSDGKKGKTGFVLSTILGFYSHYFFMFLIATQFLFLLLKLTGIIQTSDDFNYHPTGSFFHRYRRIAFTYIGLVSLAFLALVPWLMYVLSLGGASNTQPLIPPPTSFNILQSFVNFLFGFQNQNIQGILIALWPLLVMIMIFLFTQRKRIHANNFEYFILVTFLPIVLVFLASYIRPLFLSRYLILVTPTLFFVVTAALLSYSKRTSSIVTTAFIMVMFVLLLVQNISPSTPVKENYEGVAKYLEQNVRPEDVIAVSSPFTIYPIQYYYDGPARIDTIPHWDQYTTGSIPAFSQSGLQQQLTGFQKQYSYVYVVLSYDQGYEKTITEYMDKHYQLDKVLKFSPGLQVRKYKFRYYTNAK